MVHRLAEAVAEYGPEPSAGHKKMSITLPADLVDEVRQAADESGRSVSGVIAAALRHSLASLQQERLERALALDADDNAAWASDALAMTARAWADLEW
jgi:Arc/MetJ-type ribon-helix-helix transcriptional regulator